MVRHANKIAQMSRFLVKYTSHKIRYSSWIPCFFSFVLIIQGLVQGSLDCRFIRYTWRIMEIRVTSCDTIPIHVATLKRLGHPLPPGGFPLAS